MYEKIVFIPGRLFQHNLMFGSKTRSLPYGGLPYGRLGCRLDVFDRVALKTLVKKVIVIFMLY